MEILWSGAIHTCDTWGPFLETPADNFPAHGSGKYFSELIYLWASGNYWGKLSDMLHEIIKIKI